MSHTSEIQNLISNCIEKGAIPPYVYTYPPRSAYRPLERWRSIPNIWEEDHLVSSSDNLNLYIHVPFCRYKCGFCNLYTITSNDETVYDAYVDAVCLQLEQSRSIIEQRRLKTVYIGGGTPSILTPDQLTRLFDKITEIYPGWRNSCDEVCMEATPDSIVDARHDLAKFLVDLGVTRINMGVQSLKRDELKEAGRIKANEDVIRSAFVRIKQAGVSNLSTDLIMGFAGQSAESWAESVTELLKLSPETISTYFLTVRPDAWFSKTGSYRYAREPALYERYDMARELYLANGYVQETNIRYKKAGRGGYIQKRLQFQGVPYLGIGVGARTYTNTVDYIVGGSHKPNIDQMWDYVKAVRGGGVDMTAGFVYDNEERIRKRLALDLFDLDLTELDCYARKAHRWVYEPLLEAGVNLGLIAKVGAVRYQLTKQGYKYRDILSWLAFSEKVKVRDVEFYAGIHSDNDRDRTMQDAPSASSLALVGAAV